MNSTPTPVPAPLSPRVFTRRKGLPLSWVLVIPFVLQMGAAVGLTGYFSFRNSQRTVSDLALRLQEDVSDRVALHLEKYLDRAVLITQINGDAIDLGLIDTTDLETSGQYFARQVKASNLSYISYGLQSGSFVGAGRWLGEKNIVIEEVTPMSNGKSHTYETNERGDRTQLIKVDDYDFLSEPGHIDSIKMGKLGWSEIYNWEDLQEFMSIPLGFPFRDASGTIAGTVGIDLELSHVGEFLRRIEFTPSGKIFIIEQNGLMVASSSTERPFQTVDGIAIRLKATDSKDPLIQATAAALARKFGSFQLIQNNEFLEFELAGKTQWVRVTPWRDELGLDWLVVVAMPESDFMAEIWAQNRLTVGFCIASLVAATGMGVSTASRIARPIRTLGEASQAIAQGQPAQNTKISGIHELSILGQSFDQMGTQIKTSFDALANTNQQLAVVNQTLDETNRSLEQRVIDRTQELQTAKDTAEQSQQAAELANRAKSTFLANMSHELRTPLNAILGFTQIMQRDASLGPSQTEHLSIVGRSGEHLLSLINDVLDMSKIEAGQIALNSTSFDFHHLLNTTKEMLEFKADQKQLQLIFDHPQNLPRYIRTDERKLRQVLINLLNNALKFTQVGGVTLRVKALAQVESMVENAPKFIFEIEDTGAGIAPEELGSSKHSSKPSPVGNPKKAPD
jgi:signal transduction histidine kinase